MKGEALEDCSGREPRVSEATLEELAAKHGDE